MMYYSHLFFPVIFGLGCRSANSGDLFSDDESVMASASVVDFPGDASVLASNDAPYEPFLLATSPDNYPDVQTIDPSFFADGSESDPSALQPALLSQSETSPSEFHDAPPGADDGPECWWPRLAVCCEGRDLNKCIWFTWDEKICENQRNIWCCEQVLPSGRARGCEPDIKRWPGIIWGQFVDILRTPIPLPETVPLGGIFSPNE